MDIFRVAEGEMGLSNGEIASLLEKSLEGRALRNVLIIPPDFTRYHSNAGFITCAYYKALASRGVAVDVMPALGTHVPVSEAQWKIMFPDIPYGKMIVHNWRTDVVRLGEVPADAVKEISDGLWTDPVSVEVNRRIMDEKYDLIISPKCLLRGERGNPSKKSLYEGPAYAELPVARNHRHGLKLDRGAFGGPYLRQNGIRCAPDYLAPNFRHQKTVYRGDNVAKRLRNQLVRMASDHVENPAGVAKVRGAQREFWPVAHFSDACPIASVTAFTLPMK